MMMLWVLEANSFLVLWRIWGQLESWAPFSASPHQTKAYLGWERRESRAQEAVGLGREEKSPVNREPRNIQDRIIMDRDSLNLQISNMRFQAKMERWPLSKSIEA